MNFRENGKDRERKRGQKRRRKACLLVELLIKNKSTAIFNGRVYLRILRNVVPEVKELDDHWFKKQETRAQALPAMCLKIISMSLGPSGSVGED